MIDACRKLKEQERKVKGGRGIGAMTGETTEIDIEIDIEGLV